MQERPYDKPGQGFFTEAFFNDMVYQYIPISMQPGDDVFSPTLSAKDKLHQFPPTIIVYGEKDCIANDIKAFSTALQAAAVQLCLIPLANEHHNFPWIKTDYIAHFQQFYSSQTGAPSCSPPPLKPLMCFDHISETPTLPRSWNAPHANKSYVIRGRVFTDINERLNRPQAVLSQLDQPAKMVVLHGMGGVGKTQIALNYFWNSSYRTKVWLSGSSFEVLTQEYCKLASSLSMVTSSSKDDNVIKQLIQLLSESDNCLLVVDDADKPAEILPLLPKLRVRILITSRISDGWSCDKIRINTLDTDSAVAMFHCLSERRDPEAAELVNEFGGLPLAISQAAAYMRSKRKTTTQYLQLYKRFKQQLLSTQGTTQHEAVLITWDVSLQAMMEEAQTIAHCREILLQVLQFIAYLDHTSISRDLLLEWLTKYYPQHDDVEFVFEEVLGYLQQYSLITLEREHLSLHKLLQTVIRLQHQNKSPSQVFTNIEPQVRKSWYIKLIQLIIAEHESSHKRFSATESDMYFIAHFEQLLLHADSFTIAPLERPLFTLRVGLGKMYQRRGNYEKGQTCLNTCISHAEAIGDNASLAQALQSLARLEAYGGNPPAALTHLQKSLTIQKQLFGPRSLQVAKCIYELSYIMSIAGQFSAGKGLLESALDILPTDDLASANLRYQSSTLLAYDYWGCGEIPRALESLHKLEAEIDKYPDLPQQAKLDTYRYLAIICLSAEKYDLGLEYITRSIHLLGNIKECEAYVTNLNTQAHILMQLERYDEAYVNFTKALAIAKRLKLSPIVLDISSYIVICQIYNYYTVDNFEMKQLCLQRLTDAEVDVTTISRELFRAYASSNSQAADYFTRETAKFSPEYAKDIRFPAHFDLKIFYYRAIFGESYPLLQHTIRQKEHYQKLCLDAATTQSEMVVSGMTPEEQPGRPSAPGLK